MTDLSNSFKSRFLSSIPTASIENPNDHLASRSKFNFSYFTVQEQSQNFPDWNHGQLSKLLEKLKDYSREPLSYWKNQRLGKCGAVLSIYGKFPNNSDLTFPTHIPHQALWGRFRLEQSVRLCGFVIPDDYHGKPQNASPFTFCSNTFYVVFLDRDHRFYKTENS